MRIYIYASRLITENRNAQRWNSNNVYIIKRARDDQIKKQAKPLNTTDEHWKKQNCRITPETKRKKINN